jgi:hypothetical protein
MTYFEIQVSDKYPLMKAFPSEDGNKAQQTGHV